VRSGAYIQPVPSDMTGSFRALTGFDVAGIPVHRGPAVSELATVYRARAFTRAGEVFLPDDAGPVEHAETRALLAHELTHAVQQRILSPSLPPEASPHGRELEDEASHAEQWYRSGGGAPSRLAHLPVAMLLAGLSATGRGRPAPAGPVWSSFAPESVPAAASGVQRQPAGQPAASLPGLFGQQAQSGGSGQPAAAWPGPDGASASGTVAAVLTADDLELPADRPVTPGGGVSEEEFARLLANSARLAELCTERTANLDDPASLDELAAKVYQRLQGMLRTELLVDRERAGLLADIS
jgi:hypothetical protein